MNPFQSETGTFVGVDSMLNLALALPKIFAGIIFTKGYLIVVLVLVEGVSASDFCVDADGSFSLQSHFLCHVMVFLIVCLV